MHNKSLCIQLIYFFQYNCKSILDSLQQYATVIHDSINVDLLLLKMISYSMLTPEQEDYFNNSMLTVAVRQRTFCCLIVRLNEECVETFLQCLEETNHYQPHKVLLEKLRSRST